MNDHPSTSIPSALLIIFLLLTSTAYAASAPTEILRGFSATPDLSLPSTTSQPLLADQTSDYALAFLRVGDSHLALAVLHLPSSVPVWTAAPDHPARWSPRTRFSFDGNLLLSDPSSALSWSTNLTAGAAAASDRLRLRDGELQLLGPGEYVLWRSFDFPTDTLLVGQNFTGGMRLASASGLYSMRTVEDYLGLFAHFNLASHSDQLYYKHTAMQAKAQYVPGAGAVYARVDADGFLGLYQTGATPLDIIPFSTFHRVVNATRRLRLESDGNLRAYFWNTTAWALDYAAIQGRCGLPSECGPYGLCDAGAGCSCLDGKTQFGSGVAGGCSQPEYGDFCGGAGVGGEDYTVLRRDGVDLAYKKLLASEKVASEKVCEETCESECGCWGAIYTNLSGGSGMCYKLDFPVRTVVATGDETKMGYFKVRKERRRELPFGAGVFWGVVGGVGVVGAAAIAGVVYGGWRWRRRRRESGLLSGEGMEDRSYRDLDEKGMEVELSKR